MTDRVFDRLAAVDGVIAYDGRRNLYPAYAGDDRRRRPAAWIDDRTLQLWLGQGRLELCARGYRLKRSPHPHRI